VASRAADWPLQVPLPGLVTTNTKGVGQLFLEAVDLTRLPFVACRAGTGSQFYVFGMIEDDCSFAGSEFNDDLTFSTKRGCSSEANQKENNSFHRFLPLPLAGSHSRESDRVLNTDCCQW
jgi:hypothetical protein